MSLVFFNDENATIYSEQDCLRNFKRSKSMYINVGEDPEIRFLEDIEQFKFSQTILFRIYDTSGKLRKFLKFVFLLKCV